MCGVDTDASLSFKWLKESISEVFEDSTVLIQKTKDVLEQGVAGLEYDRPIWDETMFTARVPIISI